jgi:hypothetical protein
MERRRREIEESVEANCSSLIGLAGASDKLLAKTVSSATAGCGTATIPTQVPGSFLR